MGRVMSLSNVLDLSLTGTYLLSDEASQKVVTWKFDFPKPSSVMADQKGQQMEISS